MYLCGSLVKPLILSISLVKAVQVSTDFPTSTLFPLLVSIVSGCLPSRSQCNEIIKFDHGMPILEKRSIDGTQLSLLVQGDLTADHVLENLILLLITC